MTSPSATQLKVTCNIFSDMSCLKKVSVQLSRTGEEEFAAVHCLPQTNAECPTGRQTALWSDARMERDQQPGGLAGGQQHGWCRQPRRTASWAVQLLLLTGILPAANGGLCNASTDHSKVSCLESCSLTTVSGLSDVGALSQALSMQSCPLSGLTV